MDKTTAFQIENRRKFADVLQEWIRQAGLESNKPARITFSRSEDIANKLGYLAISRPKDSMIVDFGDKHLHRWKAARSVDSLVYIAYSEDPEISCYLKFRPKSMDLFYYPQDDRANVLVVNTLGAEAPKGSIGDDYGPKYVEVESADLPEQETRKLYGSNNYYITTITFPTPVLIHPKGSFWTNHDLKEALARRIAFNQFKFPADFDGLVTKARPAVERVGRTVL